MASNQQVKDYYKILEIPHTASTFEIQQAYEKLVNKYHPDRNKSNKEWAENKFHDINEAFEILYNRNSRAHYDEVYKKGYSLGDAELTFNKFFAEHDFINEEQRNFFEQSQEGNKKTKKNYFQVLGLPNSASLDQIKNAYRTLAILYHPKNTGNNPQAQKKFIQLNEAYEVLSDQKKKQIHQNLFEQNFSPFRSDKVFQDFFGHKPFEFPKEEQFFQPVLKKRWSRLLDRFMEDDFDFNHMKNGQALKQSKVYTKQNGQETTKNVKTKIRVVNGAIEETKTEQYVFPNGEREIIRSVTSNGQTQRKIFHLSKGQSLPKELQL